jgi:hypothetical protein
MDLFEFNGNMLIPSIHALMLNPYKRIWEEDTSVGHEKSLQWFRYVELVASPKRSNVFFGYSEDERPAKVKKEVFGDENYQIESDLMFMVMAYKEHLAIDSLSYQFCNSAIEAGHKVKDFLDTFNLKERTPHGAMVMKPRDVLVALKEVEPTIKNLEAARTKIHNELIASGKTRNEREIGNYER